MMGEGKLNGDVCGSSSSIPLVPVKQRGKPNSSTTWDGYIWTKHKEHLYVLPLSSPACILGHIFVSFGGFVWYFKGFEIFAHSVLVNT